MYRMIIIVGLFAVLTASPGCLLIGHVASGVLPSLQIAIIDAASHINDVKPDLQKNIEEKEK